ncbi:hypothetical protein [Persicobacter diffluens]|uniref:Uncharacterized protein n=1 Tax=Persicobacter diffluens TaxID=981 RepID=A0AAN4W1H3_9BACT|nr:hypothetical protein PEDI_34350 [Persicobacter diffluens]
MKRKKNSKNKKSTQLRDSLLVVFIGSTIFTLWFIFISGPVEIEEQNAVKTIGTIKKTNWHSGRYHYFIYYKANDKGTRLVKSSQIGDLQVGEHFIVVYDKTNPEKHICGLNFPVILKKEKYQIGTGRISWIGRKFGERSTSNIKFVYSIAGKEYEREQSSNILRFEKTDKVEIIYNSENPSIAYIIKNVSTGIEDPHFEYYVNRITKE